VNRDQENAHRVRIVFEDKNDAQSVFAGAVETSTFGSAQYKWHPGQTRLMAHAEESGKPTVVVTSKGSADPDGPIVHGKLNASKDTFFDLPAASVVVIRGSVHGK
jgi:hypothetical protein